LRGGGKEFGGTKGREKVYKIFEKTSAVPKGRALGAERDDRGKKSLPLKKEPPGRPERTTRVSEKGG